MCFLFHIARFVPGSKNSYPVNALASGIECKGLHMQWGA